MSSTAATTLLQRLQAGDGAAGEELFPLVYEELHRLAERYMSAQAGSHTLQPTALVHEAYVKLIDVDPKRLNDRAHFFRLAASAMRSILVDHARTRRRLKRGGDHALACLLTYVSGGSIAASTSTQVSCVNSSEVSSSFVCRA